jgi:hypothetical protein
MLTQKKFNRIKYTLCEGQSFRLCDLYCAIKVQLYITLIISTRFVQIWSDFIRDPLLCFEKPVKLDITKFQQIITKH